LKLLSKILVVTLLLFSVVPPHVLAAPYDITEYTIPSPDSETSWLNYGPDGNVWYVSRSTDMLGVINKDTGNITEYPVADIGADCAGLTAGPDGNLWFVRGSTDNISKRDMTTGVITDFPVENETGCLANPIAGPDGNIWFSGESSYIAKMTLTGQVTKYNIPDNGVGFGLHLGDDGNIWFADYDQNRIGKITTNGDITMYTPPNGLISAVVWGPDDNVWYLGAEGADLFVSKMSPQGDQIASYTIASGDVFSYSLALGRDGKIWVAILGTDQLARIDSNGSIDYFDAPTQGEGPFILASSIDGDLWYSSVSGNTIGRLEMPITEENASSDSDPIPDSVEDAAPGNGDGNNDGTPDSDQSNVTSLPIPSGSNAGTYVTLVVPEGSTLTTTAIEQATTLATKDSAYGYPLGLISFTVSNLTPGSTIPIELYYYTNQSPATFTPRKYNTNTSTYTTLSTQTQTSLTQTTINNQPVLKLSYQLQDGGPLDQDNQANGTIVDPVGLAQASLGVPNTGIR